MSEQAREITSGERCRRAPLRTPEERCTWIFHSLRNRLWGRTSSPRICNPLRGTAASLAVLTGKILFPPGAGEIERSSPKAGQSQTVETSHGSHSGQKAG